MMKKTNLILLAVVVLSFGSIAEAEFVQNPYDSLLADTIDLVFSVVPDAGNNSLKFQADLWGFVDGNKLSAGTAGFRWDNPYMTLDSAKTSPMTDSVWNLLHFVYHSNSIDSSNYFNGFIIGIVAAQDTLTSPRPGRQLWASYYFSLSQWATGDSIVIDTATLWTSLPYKFIIDSYYEYQPYWTGRKVVYDTPSSCCVALTGNVDNDANDICDIGDLTYLGAYLYQQGPAPVCMEEANCDGSADGFVDIGDQTALIDFLFITYTPLAPCE